MNSEEVAVDKNGVEYDKPVSYQKIKQPRYFTTVQTIGIGEKAIPKELKIYGYNKTKYLNNVVKLSLK